LGVAKERFVLRYRGEGTKPDDVVARVREVAGAEIVDASAPRMMLVDCEPEPLRELVDGLDDWVMGADQAYAVPDTRKKVERPPD
jgi:hypothetical protein